MSGEEPARARNGPAVVAVIAAAVLTPIVVWVMFDPFKGFMSEGRGFGLAVRVQNETGAEVVVEAFFKGEWNDQHPWMVAPSGIPVDGGIAASSWYGEHSLIGRDGCSYVPFRALDTGGREIERREPPLCDGDTWVIDGRDDAPSSSGEDRD